MLPDWNEYHTRNHEMKAEEARRIALDDMAFKIHVVETLGGAMEAITTLKANDVEVFGRLRELETAPRRQKINASAIAGGVAAVAVGLVEGIKYLLQRGGK
jgi:hypothetical protein